MENWLKIKSPSGNEKSGSKSKIKVKFPGLTRKKVKPNIFSPKAGNQEVLTEREVNVMFNDKELTPKHKKSEKVEVTENGKGPVENDSIYEGENDSIYEVENNSSACESDSVATTEELCLTPMQNKTKTPNRSKNSTPRLKNETPGRNTPKLGKKKTPGKNTPKQGKHDTPASSTPKQVKNETPGKNLTSTPNQKIIMNPGENNSFTKKETPVITLDNTPIQKKNSITIESMVVTPIQNKNDSLNKNSESSLLEAKTPDEKKAIKTPKSRENKLTPKQKNSSDSKAAKTIVGIEKMLVSINNFKSAYTAFNQSFKLFKGANYFNLDKEISQTINDQLVNINNCTEKIEISLQSLNPESALLNNSLDMSIENLVLEESYEEIKYENEDDMTMDCTNVEKPFKENLNQEHESTLTPPISEIGSERSQDIVSKDDSSTTTDGNTGQKRKYKKRKSNCNLPKKRARKSLVDNYAVFDKIGSREDDEEEQKTKEENENNEDKDDTPTPPGEYEVDLIRNYSKVKGKYLFRVSWKGYKPDDDTYEPVSNLTGCDEVLIEFFRQRFRARSECQNPVEFLKLPMPTDSYLQPLLKEAFIEELYCNETEKPLIPLGSKQIKLKSEEELQFEIVRLAGMREQRQPKYNNLQESIIKQLSLMDTRKLREKHSARLRQWERQINQICSDPVPLAIENTVDFTIPSKSFVYINDYLPGKGIDIPSDPIVGCNCDDCSSTQKNCCANQMNSFFAYTKYGKLRVSLGTAIYECNKLCKCPPDCSNRVVQRGRMVKLCIFKTSNGRGWGVKTLEHIKKDSFVTEYVGEVIRSEEAERRGEIYDSRGCTYLFDLDYNKGDLNPYTVDATRYGNVSHFINHSCDPNLVVFNVWINCLDPDIPKLALFASRDIKKGEELSFDYNFTYAKTSDQNADTADDAVPDSTDELLTQTPESKFKEKSFTPESNRKTNKQRTPNGGKTVCKCGAANCRGYFF